MTTDFRLLCDRCGLSYIEAAEFLGVRPDSVAAWSSGRREAPDGVMEELCDLYARIEDAAEAEDFDDLPCDGAKEAARGIFVARSGAWDA